MMDIVAELKNTQNTVNTLYRDSASAFGLVGVRLDGLDKLVADVQKTLDATPPVVIRNHTSKFLLVSVFALGVYSGYKYYESEQNKK